MTRHTVRTLLALLATVALGVPALAQDTGPPVTRRRPAKPQPPAQGTAAPAQAGEGSRAATGPENSTFVLRCDLACVVTIDGAEVARLEARVTRKHTVAVGEHIVEATTTDGKKRWEQIVRAEGKGQKIVNIELVAAAAAEAVAAAATTSPDQFDRAAAGVYASIDDVRVAGSAIGSALKRNFGFHKASNDALHLATQNLKRASDGVKLLTPGDEPRKKAATDMDRAGGAADQYAQLMAKALVSAQEKNSARGEPQDLTAQAMAALPGMNLAPDTLQLLGQSSAFRDALPADLQARVAQDPMDVRLGAESLSASPLLIVDVQKGSLAEDLGLKAGDRLIAVGGKELSSLMDFKRGLRDAVGGRVMLTFEREGKRQDRELKVPGKLP
ncbi:MAG: PDZ domain-containing protein [Vicinamibacteria bacterium]|nr:PDZ domain-containing protein [Vicinamibacteria bacterium]